MQTDAIGKISEAAPLKIPDEMLREVHAAYQVPPRRYHSLEHILAVLDHYALVARDIGWQQPREVFLAALYHDAIYVCGSSDNETQSAAFATAAIAKWLPDQGIDAERVAALIELTATHGHNQRDQLDGEAALFLDCDLAILGAEPDAYATFRQQVAAEYLSVMPEVAYNAGRKQFLSSVLAAERVFLSDFFEQRLGDKARANVAAELDLLAGS